MIQLFRMAFRDLGRNRRRSFFSSLALGMGLALLLLMASVVEGEMRGAMNSSILLQSGHLQVRAASYEEAKTSLAYEDLLENPQALADQIATLDAVSVATPRLYASGITANGDRSMGVRIVGIDPPSAANMPYHDGLVAGEYLSAGDREGVLLGQALAEKLGLKPGDPVNLMINTSNGEVDEQVFTIRGLYATGITSYDKTTVIMPLAKVQAITRAENHASIIFILLHDREQTDAVAAALQTGYQVKTFKQMNAILTQTEEMSKAYMVLLYLIVLAITATVIVNTLVMAVFERTREIGILAAIGMKGWRIMAMFFAESSLLAVGGILLGLAMGALMVWYATDVGFYIGNMGMTGILLGDRIYAYLTLENTITLTITAFIVTLLAALYPALLAARMEPVEALHGGN
jgi:ABC-type lipoprotein release transport system permease subunit